MSRRYKSPRLFFQKVAEMVTGKHCEKCKHNRGFECTHPNPKVSKKCRLGIFPAGFEKGDQA